MADDDDKNHGFRFLYIHSSKWRRIIQLLVTCALGALAVLLTRPKPLSKPVEPLRAKATVTTTTWEQSQRLVPLRLEMKLCGNFAEQRMQTLTSLLAGLLLGAQVVLPERMANSELDFGALFDVHRLRRSVRKAYTKYWCVRRKSLAHHVWCSSTFVAPLLLVSPEEGEALVETVGLRNSSEELPKVSERLWHELFPNGMPEVANMDGSRSVLLQLECKFYKQLRAVEPLPPWRFFSYLSESLVPSAPVREIFDTMKRNMFIQFLDPAVAKAKALGYQPVEEVSFGVLEINERYCHSREHCLDLGNILLSEGVVPSMPFYLSGKSRKLDRILKEVFTVVTKDLIYFEDIDDLSLQAVNFLMAKDATLFVGPSYSMSSSMALLARRQAQAPCFHYDGQQTMLEAEKIFQPLKSTEPELFRSPVKWVFTLAGRKSISAAWNHSLASIRSSFMADVIPVCVTDAEPSSPMTRLLLEMGVRVIHHRPKWLETLRALAETWRVKAQRKWKFVLNDWDDFIGSFYRIDIPVVGFIDRLVLYTDVDILFKERLSWELLMDTPNLSFEQYAKPGHVGVPEFLAMTGEMVHSSNPEKADSGVMVMNLRNLQETYNNFTSFLFDRKQPWSFQSGDPCNYKPFYRNKGKLLVSALPHALNWKPYWENNPYVVIMHFHGPKCDPDITQHLYKGSVVFEPFRGLLEKCMGSSCQKLCHEYQNYLSHGQELISKQLRRP